MGVGFGEASTDNADGPGVERLATAGEGGGGIELRAGVDVGAASGVDTDFWNAFGSFAHSRSLAELMRSLTMRLAGSAETLSSRASFLLCLDGRTSCCRAASSGVAERPMADRIAA